MYSSNVLFREFCHLFRKLFHHLCWRFFVEAGKVNVIFFYLIKSSYSTLNRNCKLLTKVKSVHFFTPKTNYFFSYFQNDYIYKNLKILNTQIKIIHILKLVINEKCEIDMKMNIFKIVKHFPCLFMFKHYIYCIIIYECLNKRNLLTIFVF